MKIEVPLLWLTSLQELAANMQDNLEDFTLDGTPEYNRRAVEFMQSGLIGHIESSKIYTGGQGVRRTLGDSPGY